MSIWSHISDKVRATVVMMATDALEWRRGVAAYAPLVGVLHVQRGADPMHDGQRNMMVYPMVATLKLPDDTATPLIANDNVRTGNGDVWVVVGPADKMVNGQFVYSLKIDETSKIRPNRGGTP